MEMVHFIPPGQRRLAVQAAQADSEPVLITGASGTGKGAIARWIHSNGPRSACPFIVAHHDEPLVTQIPKALGGTLVVPEIGEWPLGEQKVLLGFLTTKSIPHPESPDLRMLINARVIVTTNQALNRRAQGGLFNTELLEKISTFRIDMPPLTSRQGEFQDIVTGILREITRELHKDHIRSISLGAWDRLMSYDWPGNLRELRNVLRIAALSCDESEISEKDLPAFGYDRIDFRATREEFEKIYILELLKSSDWQIDKTCELAKLSKEALLSKMDQHGIGQDQPMV